MELTETKYNIINNFLNIHKNDKTYYEIVCLKDVPKNFEIHKNVKLHKFVYDNKHIFNKNSKKLDLVYEIEYIKYKCTITKINKYVTKKIINNLKDYNDPLIKKMIKKFEDNFNFVENKRLTYIYINVENIKLQDDNEYNNVIFPDFCFGIYNIQEIKQIYNKENISELLKFDDYYDNIDFNNIVTNNDIIPDNYIYHINFNFDNCYCDLNGRKIKGTSFDYIDLDDEIINNKRIKSFEILKTFMYQKYYTTRKAWYGYLDRYLYDNHMLILKNRNEDKYMFVIYCVDDASCDGYLFTLKTYLYDSLDSLWKNIDDNLKCKILQVNLFPDFDFKIENGESFVSDSDPDD
jgi:hypothetical protein